MKKTTLFKQLIEAEEILIAPGIHDGITARLVQAMGFKSGTISGAGVSNSRLGKPDFGLLGLEDNVAQCRNLANCVDIPLQADADTGYGNAVNVYHTVQAFEQAGVRVLLLESAPREFRGGNSRHTRNLRFMHERGNYHLTGPDEQNPSS